MQARSALFLKRENALLASLFIKSKGQVALLYGDVAGLDFQGMTWPFVFKAGARREAGLDAVFSAGEWPFPPHFFDLVLLSRPRAQGEALAVMIKAAKAVLRPDGRLLISGRAGGSLKILSALQQQDFTAKVHRFHVCRPAALNRFLEKALPFLARGWMIEARLQTISLTPLQEKDLGLLMERLLARDGLGAEPVMKQVDHDA